MYCGGGKEGRRFTSMVGGTEQCAAWAGQVAYSTQQNCERNKGPDKGQAEPLHTLTVVE